MRVEPKWRRFEKLVAQVQEELAPNAIVTHNDQIRGHDSGKLRQIDITVKQRVGQYDILIVIDCKDYTTPVDLNEVERFVGLVRDIRANKGVMVAATGFTDTAKRYGENQGLNLYRLVDTEAHDWQTYVSIPIICDFRGIKSYQFIFHTPLLHVLSQMDPWETIEIMLYDVNRQAFGKVSELLKTSWNSNELPSEPGEHRDITLTKEPTMMLYDDEFFDVSIAANIIVESRLYFGQLQLTDVKGLRDEHTGRLLTREFTTDWLNVTKVERNWRRLRSEDEVAVTPLLKLQALDYYTE